MGFLVSPGVEVNEIDMTNIIPALSTSIGAYAGRFNWGPAGQIVTVSSEAELASAYGTPTTNDGLARSFFTAASFLKYGNTLRISRAIPTDAVNAYSGSALASPVSSLEEFEAIGAGAGVYARYPGALANGLKVLVITEYSDGDYVYGSGNVGNGNTAATSSYLSSLSYLPGTTAWAKSLTGQDMYDECTVLVIDVEGKFGSTRGAILEKFEGLSLASNAKTEDGANNYFINVVNAKSQYVYLSQVDTLVLAGVPTGGIVLTATSDPSIIAYDNPQIEFVLDDGTNGTETDLASNVSDALELFNEAESSDINFIFAESISETDAEQGTIDGALISITGNRKDAIAFISAPLSIAFAGIANSAAVKTSTVIDYFNSETYASTSYAVLGSTPVQMYNKYVDRYIWVPDCGHVAGLCAYTDGVTDPWFSPAGLNRGQLRGVSKLALNPNQTQRDDLYKARINPIVSFPGEGIVLYGDKTALSRPSAFDRINVRRLFITLEKAIATFAKYQLFELNDEFTRAAFKAAVEPYLRTVQARRGITDFRVICDTTNNTGAVIDANGFVADIYIKPARSINFITLNFIATRTGVEFKEIVGG